MIDIHTHIPKPHAIISVDPSDQPPHFTHGYHYSVGIHPWHANSGPFANVEALAQSPQVVAIGETGLDRLKGPSIDVQLALLHQHIALSEQLHKPLILHCVKAFNELIALHRQTTPTQPWIIHGFRGKPQLAAQLVKENLYLSFGQHFNPAVLESVPPHRILLETDCSNLPISQIAQQTGLDLTMLANTEKHLFPTID